MEVEEAEVVPGPLGSGSISNCSGLLAPLVPEVIPGMKSSSLYNSSTTKHFSAGALITTASRIHNLEMKQRQRRCWYLLSVFGRSLVT